MLLPTIICYTKSRLHWKLIPKKSNIVKNRAVPAFKKVKIQWTVSPAGAVGVRKNGKTQTLNIIESSEESNSYCNGPSTQRTCWQCFSTILARLPPKRNNNQPCMSCHPRLQISQKWKDRSKRRWGCLPGDHIQMPCSLDSSSKSDKPSWQFSTESLY